MLEDTLTPFMVLLCVMHSWFLLGYISAGYLYANFQMTFPAVADRDRASDTTFCLLLCVPCGYASFVFVITALVGDTDCGWLMPGRKPTMNRKEYLGYE